MNGWQHRIREFEGQKHEQRLVVPSTRQNFGGMPLTNANIIRIEAGPSSVNANGGPITNALPCPNDSVGSSASGLPPPIGKGPVLRAHLLKNRARAVPTTMLAQASPRFGTIGRLSGNHSPRRVAPTLPTSGLLDGSQMRGVPRYSSVGGTRMPSPWNPVVTKSVTNRNVPEGAGANKHDNANSVAKFEELPDEGNVLDLSNATDADNDVQYLDTYPIDLTYPINLTTSRAREISKHRQASWSTCD